MVKIIPRISNEETMMQSDDDDDIAADDSICINVPKQANTKQKPVTNFASARAENKKISRIDEQKFMSPINPLDSNLIVKNGKMVYTGCAHNDSLIVKEL